MKKLIALSLPLIPACWLGMQQVHELGHVIAAWSTGGTVTQVVLDPLTISRTDVAPNPSPLVVVWGGPVLGVVLPLVVWGLARMLRLPGSFLLRFFAGFCLVANGGYIAGGSFDGLGDCGPMLQHGTPIYLLWVFGVAAMMLGLFLWNGQGKHFGFGREAVVVSWNHVWVCWIALGLLLAIGVVDGS